MLFSHNPGKFICVVIGSIMAPVMNIPQVISPFITENIFIFPCLALVQIMLGVFLNIFFGAHRREFLLVLLDHRLYLLTLPLDVCVCIPVALHLELSDLSICHPCEDIILHHYGLIFISPWFWEPFTPIAKLISSFVNYLFKCSVFGWQRVRQNGGPDFDWFIVFYIFSRSLLLAIYSVGDI